MHMTQTVHTDSTHSQDICESGTHLRPKCQIIISTALQYVARTCHLSSTQMVIGAPTSPPPPACFQLRSDL